MYAGEDDNKQIVSSKRVPPPNEVENNAIAIIASNKAQPRPLGPACCYVNDKERRVLLPRYLYAKDIYGRYLRVQKAATRWELLTIAATEPNADCIFESTRRDDGKYNFKGNNGHYFNHYSFFSEDPDILTCDSTDSHGVPMRVVHESGDQVLLEHKQCWSSADKHTRGGVCLYPFIQSNSRYNIVAAAVRKTSILDIEYNIANATVTNVPTVILDTVLENDTDAPVSRTVPFSYNRMVEGTWNDDRGIMVGLGVTFVIGVPYVENEKLDIAVSPATQAHVWAGTEGVSATVGDEITVVVPPRKKGIVEVVLRNARIKVPFKYKYKSEFLDDRIQLEERTGIYKNVDIYGIEVKMSNWEDL
ncbi:uncharacterized protein LAESUDRAFT_497095 [Laetiporus sulphureus 93-53]|uniref:Agglutinin domain-containing protein n=1 Tax=Laetiporus sulphureus 93-53 TaxID=1314785 RepID=A0A165BH33_9APHY|nr:uncharacterized protein LAESUDRAFT_497095 [Laetiporus sulphureus 93-53]KZT01042.1 hypothetical protein LAESUDRAFT_497095 [Laetiporus sulphureus 93-53]